MNSILIFGCGYLGERLARRAQADGRTVCAVTRSPERAERFRRAGWQATVADVTRPETLRGLPRADTVVYAIGYNPRATASREAVQIDGLAAVLGALPPPGRLIYVSSTSVYGAGQTGRIDQHTPCRPSRPAGRVQWAAEQRLRSDPLGAAAVVLRLAGLYGPGRIGRLEDLKAGRALAVAEAGHLNLVHVNDAVEAILAAERSAPPGSTYLVSDGQPVPRREFYRCVAGLLGLPPPRFVEPPGGDPDARGRSDKKIDARPTIAELGVRLRYPSYREGLAAIVRGEGSSPPD